MSRIYISDYNCITPLGFDVQSNWKAMLSNESGIKKHKISEKLGTVYASKIDDEKIIFEDSKNNWTRFDKILIQALKPIIEKNAIKENSALILSTTKGNIAELKNKNQIPDEAYLSHTAKKLADYFGFKTQPIVVSNACVSGIMAVSIGKDLIDAEIFDNAYIIAADEVTEFVVSGFNSFQAMSSEPCKPYDAERNGITIGEAAAAMFLTKEKTDFEIIGSSSTNDANHISGPSRTGEGLFRSVKNAISEAEISAKQIDFISAHGTATIYNDEMESIAFNRLEMSNTPLHSLKGYYGHCLGASGLLELIIALESSKNNMLIATKNFEKQGTSELLNIIKENEEKNIDIFLKTASGFGGCNSAIIVKKTN